MPVLIHRLFPFRNSQVKHAGLGIGIAIPDGDILVDTGVPVIIPPWMSQIHFRDT